MIKTSVSSGVSLCLTGGSVNDGFHTLDIQENGQVWASGHPVKHACSKTLFLVSDLGWGGGKIEAVRKQGS